MKKATLATVIMLASVIGVLPVGAGCPSADLNGDCQVDLEDFGIVSAQWLITYDQVNLTQITDQWRMGPVVPAGIEFATIPGGTFQMGDSFSEGLPFERPVHTVTVSSFKMSRHAITAAQYVHFLNEAAAAGLVKERYGTIYPIDDHVYGQPWCDISSWYGSSPIVYDNGVFSVQVVDGEDRSNHPVVHVSWIGAKAFCDQYGFIFPTEAQWEYAARSGEAGRRYPWGNTITHDLANYYSDPYYAYDISDTRGYHPHFKTTAFNYTAPVGTFAPTGYGLHEMIGNVYEWCGDWYADYSAEPQIDPTGPTTKPEIAAARVTRGGCWQFGAYYCRNSSRSAREPDFREPYIGFRVVQP